MWNWLLGLSAAQWTALGTMVLAGLTLFIVIAGWIQLRAMRHEADKERTIAMCDRYDFDPVLDPCLRRLSVATGHGGDYKTNADKYKSDVVTVLNYLDSMAVGIKQGIYIESLAHDHSHVILRGHVKELLGLGAPNIVGIDSANYAELIELNKKWSTTPPTYRAGWKLWKKR